MKLLCTRYFFLLLLVLPILGMKAEDEKENQKTDNGVLVIPFNPSMYFCAGDQFICQASNITPAELNKTIRAGVASSMMDKLYGSFPANAISEKSDVPNKKSDVEELYSIAQYSLEDKPMLAYYNKNSSSYPTKSIFKHKDEPEYLNPAKPNLKKHRYYKAHFSDTSRLGTVLRHYKVNYVLFIDHFEMETRFKDCVDMHNNVSARDLYVHYTLLNAKGEFKDGGVVCMTYQSTSNNAQELMKNTLPSLSAMILQEIKPALK